VLNKKDLYHYQNRRLNCISTVGYQRGERYSKYRRPVILAVEPWLDELTD
jgi:hypothetical protein